MNKVIYEASLNEFGISTDFIVLILITVLLITFIIIFWNKMDKGSHILFPCIAVFLIFIVCSQFHDLFREKHTVYDAYIKGDYKTVEGIITDYHIEYIGLYSEIEYDSFCVNDIEFSVPGCCMWGYSLRAQDGGVLKNGMRVRIKYNTFTFENEILKLELIS